MERKIPPVKRRSAVYHKFKFMEEHTYAVGMTRMAFLRECHPKAHQRGQRRVYEDKAAV